MRPPLLLSAAPVTSVSVPDAPAAW
jgi:hypothetical protein